MTNIPQEFIDEAVDADHYSKHRDHYNEYLLRETPISQFTAIEPVFGQNYTVPLVSSRKPNFEALKAVARLPIYMRFCGRAKEIHEWLESQKNDKGLYF
jgi:hypothetical protein